MDRGAYLVDQLAIGKVDGHQGGAQAAGGPNFVVEFFQPAGRARGKN
jgi:hypothetical protein